MRSRRAVEMVGGSGAVRLEREGAPTPQLGWLFHLGTGMLGIILARIQIYRGIESGVELWVEMILLVCLGNTYLRRLTDALLARRQEGRTVERSVRGFLVLPVMLVALWGTYRSELLFRGAFLVAKPALLRLEPDYGDAHKRWAFPYMVRVVEPSGEARRWQVRNNMSQFDDHRAGFAYCPGGCEGYRWTDKSRLGKRPRVRNFGLGGDWYWWEQTDEPG